MRMRSYVLGALGLGVSLAVACAASNDGASDDGSGDVAPRIDAAPVVADDGAVLGDPNLIDDLEDGDGSINEIMGRIGSWYAFTDGTAGATATPDEKADFTAGSPG